MVKDVPVDLLTLESTKPVDKHRQFRGWSRWKKLANEPLHRAILSGERYIPREMGCLRCDQGNIIISKYTLFGKSFSLKLPQLTII
jgi:hypothetical protein